jgi:hypothetical protein
MLITFLIFTAIIFSFLIGLTVWNKHRNQYKAQLYTLVIETNDINTDESTYETHKFIFDEDRQSYIDSHTINLLASGFQQDGRQLFDNKNSIYVILHEID